MLPVFLPLWDDLKGLLCAPTSHPRTRSQPQPGGSPLGMGAGGDTPGSGFSPGLVSAAAGRRRTISAPFAPGCAGLGPAGAGQRVPGQQHLRGERQPGAGTPHGAGAAAGLLPPTRGVPVPQGMLLLLLLRSRPLGESGLRCPGAEVAVMELALNN